MALTTPTKFAPPVVALNPWDAVIIPAVASIHPPAFIWLANVDTPETTLIPPAVALNPFLAVTIPSASTFLTSS